METLVPNIDGRIFFQHPPEAVSAFEVQVDIPGVADGLSLRTLNGLAGLTVALFQRSGGAMVCSCRIEGRWDQGSGEYELIVTDADGGTIHRKGSRG